MDAKQIWVVVEQYKSGDQWVDVNVSMDEFESRQQAQDRVNEMHSMFQTTGCRWVVKTLDEAVPADDGVTQ